MGVGLFDQPSFSGSQHQISGSRSKFFSKIKVAPINHIGGSHGPNRWLKTDRNIHIDWNDEINKQTAGHGVLLYALQAGIALAKNIDQQTADLLQEKYEWCRQAARDLLRDDSGNFVSGAARQINLQGQVWMILGGALEKQEAHHLMSAWLQEPIVNISTPYMMHYLVEALIYSGNDDLALKEIKHYWGGMIKNGADTYWEAYKPGDRFFSPYGDRVINSYCHAWSCTPTILLKKLID